PIRVLIESTQAAHPPPWLPSPARWLIRPSLPTAFEMRANSRVIFSFNSMISFRVSAILASDPVPSTEMRTEKSPRRNAFKTFSNSRLSSASALATLRELIRHSWWRTDRGVTQFALYRLWKRAERYALEIVCVRTH